MKTQINFASVIIGIIGYAFGGWTLALQTLVFVMVVDYVTGLWVAFKKRSNKTKSGGLSSSVGAMGLLKKVAILTLCAVAYRIDILVHSEGLVYNAVVCFYISNEAISILENLGKLKVKIPKKLRVVLDALQEEANGD